MSEHVIAKSRFCDASIEMLSVEMQTKVGSLLLCLHYRPPGRDTSLVELETALDSLRLASFSRVILLGDFNVDLLVDSPTCSDLAGLVAIYGLTQVISEPTRVTSSTSSLLDHVYTSSVAHPKPFSHLTPGQL